MTSTPKYTVKKLLLNGKTVTIPHTKLRSKITTGVYYTLTQEDVRQDRGQIWANLAFKFLGDPSLWTFLVDNNPPISDMHLQEGFEVFIPNINS